MGLRRYDETTFRDALADPGVRTMADLCRAVGIVPRGANYETLRQFGNQLNLDVARHLAQRQLGLDDEHVAQLRREGIGVDQALKLLGQPPTERRRQSVRIVLGLGQHAHGPSEPAGRAMRSYTDEQLCAAIGRASGFGELCALLGLSCVSGTRARLRRRAEEIGVPLPAAWSRPGPGPGGSRRRPDADGRRAPTRGPARPTPTSDELQSLVTAAGCLADVLRGLELEPTSSNYAWLRRALDAFTIDADHLRWGTRSPIEPLDEILVEGRARSSPWLRKRLIAEGRREPRCARCQGTSWQGFSMPLELDHIDGDRGNNRDDNLQLLCPNCHALTPTYRGRNIGRQALRDAST